MMWLPCGTQALGKAGSLDQLRITTNIRPELPVCWYLWKKDTREAGWEKLQGQIVQR